MFFELNFPFFSDEQQYLMDSLENDERETLPLNLPSADSPVSGILKGGKLWRQQSAENNSLKQQPEQISVRNLCVL